jgi:hypothetical protein
VKWTPSQPIKGRVFKPIQALIVDNEPTPFWDGADAGEQFARWFERVGWREDWGSAEPAAARFNGPSGNWVAEHILAPLGLTYEDTCISDCLDMARLNPGQAGRVADTYEPLRTVLDLPDCTLEPVPVGEAGIVAESEAHLERLDRELTASAPDLVVTLGNAALRVMGRLLSTSTPTARRLAASGYGSPVAATHKGRALIWRPLVHPRNGERSPTWRDAHHGWEAAALS